MTWNGPQGPTSPNAGASMPLYIDGADPTAFAADVSSLTPDALMSYCQTQVGGLDAQIKGYFDKQQAANAERSALNDVLGLLNSKVNGFTDHDVCHSLDDKMAAAIATAGGPTTALGAQLQSIADDMKATGDGQGGDNQMADFEVKAFITRVTGVQNDINNTSELDMIQLQSLSQKRATALQLCTNLVQSFGDQAKQITANVGH